MENPSVVLRSTGLFKPEEQISNEELVYAFNQYVDQYNMQHESEIKQGIVDALDYSDTQFIEKASGIKSRYVIDKEGILNPDLMYPLIHEKSNDQLSVQAEMGVFAAKDAIKQAKMDVSEIDMVILSSSTLQRAYPAVSIEIQKELGIQGFAFDMSMACSSATFGMQMAYNAIVAKSANAVLVVNVEICTAHLNFKDRDSHFIFGDVATAFILQREDMVKEKSQSFRVLSTSLYTDFSNNIRNNFGFLNRCDPEKQFNKDKLFVQNGRKVFKDICPAVGNHILKHLNSIDIDPSEIKRFWLHQANLAMNQLIIRRLLGRDASEEEAPIILDEYANTSSAGSIIAFHLFNKGLNSGELGILSSFGAGYSIGSVILEKC